MRETICLIRVMMFILDFVFSSFKLSDVNNVKLKKTFCKLLFRLFLLFFRPYPFYEFVLSFVIADIPRGGCFHYVRQKAFAV